MSRLLNLSLPAVALALSLAAPAHAVDFKATFDGEYASYQRILKFDTARSRNVLSNVLKGLGCGNTKLCVEVLKRPGIFRRMGKVRWTLTAGCSKPVQDFKFAIYPAVDFDERTEVNASWTNGAGKTSKQKKELGGITEGDWARIKDSDPSCY